MPVTASEVGKRLGCARATVYALVEGRRGSGKIEPLPCKKDKTLTRQKKPTLIFDEAAVDAWKARTGFANKHGVKGGGAQETIS